MILRRLYLYLVSTAGLVLLAVGLSMLGITLLLFAFNNPNAQDIRTQLAGFTAMTLVALPVWGVHFWFARRLAMRAFHSAGPVSCTDVPLASTATVTGMSTTSNS